MAVRKIAISLPENVLKEVDRLAKRTKTSRSGCIARLLTDFSHASSQAEVTERINKLLADSAAADEQSSIVTDFAQAADKSFEETEW